MGQKKLFWASYRTVTDWDGGSGGYRKGAPVIETLSDLPSGVVGVRLSGRLSGQEFREFRPNWEKLVGTGQIRFVEVIDDDYEGFGRGGLIVDTKMGFGALFRHHSAFTRLAVVTDKEWVVHVLHALAWMVPGEFKVFGLDDLEAAKQWAGSD